MLTMNITMRRSFALYIVIERNVFYAFNTRVEMRNQTDCNAHGTIQHDTHTQTRIHTRCLHFGAVWRWNHNNVLTHHIPHRTTPWHAIYLCEFDSHTEYVLGTTSFASKRIDLVYLKTALFRHTSICRDSVFAVCGIHTLIHLYIDLNFERLNLNGLVNVFNIPCHGNIHSATYIYTHIILQFEPI